MKKIQLYLIFFLWSFQTLQAQMYFNNRYDVFGSWDVASSIVATDSNYFVASFVTDSNNFYRSCLQSIGLNGVELFRKSIGKSNWYFRSGISSSMIVSHDTCLVLAGAVYDAGTTYLVSLIKYNLNGDTLWTKQYGDSIHFYTGYQCKQTPDHGFIIVGAMDDGNSTQALLIKTDSSGNKLWERNYGGSGIEYGFSVCLTLDGGYLLAGETTTGTTGGSNQYLVKTDSLGNVQWVKSYGTNYNENARVIIQIRDGNYVYCGFQGSSTTNYTWPTLTKIDTAGNILWDKKFGPLLFSTLFYDLRESSEGEIVAIGKTKYSGNPTEGLIVKADSLGNQIWYRRVRKVTSTSGVQILYGMDLTNDNGMVACGYVGPEIIGVGSQDIWVIKLDEWGCDTAGCQFVGIEEEYESKDVALRVYPNPSSGIFTFEYNFSPEKDLTLEVFDLSGRCLLAVPLNDNNGQAIINLSHLTEGMYFYKLMEGHRRIGSGKVMVTR